MFLKFCSLLALIVALLATYFYKDITNLIGHNDIVDQKPTLEKEIIKSWMNIDLPNRNLDRNFRIAVGMNTNVDLILSGPTLFKALHIDSNETVNCQYINSLKSFKECFMHFFRKGSAAERSFRAQQDFDRVIESTENLEKKVRILSQLIHENSWLLIFENKIFKYFIGGNAGLMAESIATKVNNTDVYLIGPVGPTLRKLLNSNIKVPIVIDQDEIHLILEYTANEDFEGIKTPTANRFIVSHDIHNSEMKMLEDFFVVINQYKPDLIILSGLHLLESQSADFRAEKLQALKNHLTLNHEVENVIHLELASIGDKTLMKNILEYNFLHHINSLGLNEQELLFLAHSAGNAPHTNYYNEISGQPDLLKVIDILEWILNTYGKSEAHPHRRLTRLHFHCLVFHIIVVKDKGIWSSIESSLMAGSKIASKQAAGLNFHDSHNEQDIEALFQFKMNHDLDENNQIQFKIGPTNESVRFDPARPVIEFRRSDNKFFFTPVLVCKEPQKTVGLGDAISSIGLVYSVFKH